MQITPIPILEKKHLVIYEPLVFFGKNIGLLLFNTSTYPNEKF